jgi:hypothetical protein
MRFNKQTINKYANIKEKESIESEIEKREILKRCKNTKILYFCIFCTSSA